jgi:hypothetical protein
MDAFVQEPSCKQDIRQSHASMRADNVVPFRIDVGPEVLDDFGKGSKLPDASRGTNS